MRIGHLLGIGALCAALCGTGQAAIITSVAGGGWNGQYATRISLQYTKAIAIIGSDHMYVADLVHVYRIDPDGLTRVIAGTDTPGYSGDGGPATAAQINDPTALAVDAAGNVYFADTGNNRVRRIGTDGIITTVAGTGVIGAAVDGPATASPVSYPSGLAIGPDGLLYIADSGNERVRRLNADGTLQTVAGGGSNGFGDGGPATGAYISTVRGLAFDRAGALYLVGSERIRRIGTDGIITTVAGGGFSTDDGPVLNARLSSPWGLTVDAFGNLYVTETGTSRVRKIANGSIVTVAGRMNGGYLDGDGGEATLASLNRPHAVATDSEGNVYIADSLNARVRKLALAGTGLPRTGEFPFQAAQGMNVAITPMRVKVGDVTGDGRDDIVLVQGSASSINPAIDNRVAVYPRKPGGGFADPIIVKFFPDQRLITPDLHLADMNRDGIDDIVIGHRLGVSILLGNRNGTLTSRNSYLSTPSSLDGSVAVLDVNRDGYLDVAHQRSDVGNPGARDFNVFFGSPGGAIMSLAPINTSLRGGYPLHAIDVNDDGIKDLVAMVGGRLYLFLHDGISGFKSEVYFGEGVAYIGSGDFDDDGRINIVDSAGNEPSYAVWVLGQRMVTNYLLSELTGADMDGDGRDDLIAVAKDKLFFYRQNDFGLSEASIASASLGRIAVGDLNGDGCKDVVGTTTNASFVQIHYGKNCVNSKPASSDIEGNGRSDLIWRDDARQHVAIWGMSGAERLYGVGHNVPPEWRVIATGDFNGDRKLDLIWTDGVSMQLWQGRGDGYFDGVMMRGYPSGYRVVATGDITGDGNADLLWRNDANTAMGLWAMNGAQVIDSQSYSTSPDWWVAGSGDLSGDGRLDLIWTNGASMQLWRAVGDKIFAGDTMPDFPQGWELGAVGDVTGDGKADLLWRLPGQPHVAAWAMDGAARLSGAPYLIDANWRIAQSGDYNGDGVTDLIWTDGSRMRLWQAVPGGGFGELEMPAYPLGWSTIRR